MGLLFKNHVQQNIDEFKGMQDGLRRASHNNDRVDQQVSSVDHIGAVQCLSEPNAEPIDEIPSSVNEQQTIVSGKAFWEGKLRTETSARIEGTISGEIEAGETIFIASGAHVHANVHARRVIIAGELEGQVTCRERLVVKQSGRLAGKVRTKAIIIAEGAFVQSQIQMLCDKESA